MENALSYQLAEADKVTNRLDLLERLYDPQTIDRLRSIEVEEGWHCFVPGAGRGSIVACLSEMVGPLGSVLATDIRPQVSRSGQPSNVTWIQHDLMSDRISANRFDLVCIRLLFVHLKNPLMAMQKIASALRPGGWLLIEEYEFPSPDDDAKSSLTDFWQGVIRHWAQQGQNFTVGRDLERLISENGLELRWVRRSPNELKRGSLEAQFHRMTALQVKEMLISSGALTQDVFDASMEALEHSTHGLYGPTMTAAAAQKP